MSGATEKTQRLRAATRARSSIATRRVRSRTWRARSAEGMGTTASPVGADGFRPRVRPRQRRHRTCRLPRYRVRLLRTGRPPRRTCRRPTNLRGQARRRRCSSSSSPRSSSRSSDSSASGACRRRAKPTTTQRLRRRSGPILQRRREHQRRARQARQPASQFGTCGDGTPARCSGRGCCSHHGGTGNGRSHGSGHHKKK